MFLLSLKRSKENIPPSPQSQEQDKPKSAMKQGKTDACLKDTSQYNNIFQKYRPNPIPGAVWASDDAINESGLDRRIKPTLSEIERRELQETKERQQKAFREMVGIQDPKEERLAATSNSIAVSILNSEKKKK